jgi:hypothetical protein
MFADGGDENEMGVKCNQVFVCVVVFLLTLKVQLCSLVKDVTYNKRDAKTSELKK